MTVPLSDEVARREPVEFRDKKEMGDLCAWMTFATVSERVENMITSPDVCATGEFWLVTDWVELDAVGEGTGEGYAR